MEFNTLKDAVSSETFEILPEAEKAIWNSYLETATDKLKMTIEEAVATLPDLDHYLHVKDAVWNAMKASFIKDTTVRFTEAGIATGCMTFEGTPDVHGYGPHRKTYKRIFGEESIPEGFEIDHICDNRGCQHPAHMVVTTRKRNQNRAALRTFCKSGEHLLSETGDARGACNECHKATKVVRRKAIKAGTWVRKNKASTLTHCPNGELWENVKVYVRPDGRRECMHCRALQVSKYRKSLATA